MDLILPVNVEDLLRLFCHSLTIYHQPNLFCVLWFVDFSRRNSLELGDHSRESEFVVLKERKLVPILPVYNGMLRFSFLLETCQPGSVPDPHLLAATLDLVSGVCFPAFFYSYVNHYCEVVSMALNTREGLGVLRRTYICILALL